MKNTTPTPDAAINNNSNTALMLTREEVEARLRATIAELEAHLVTMTAAHAKAANERQVGDVDRGRRGAPPRGTDPHPGRRHPAW